MKLICIKLFPVLFILLNLPLIALSQSIYGEVTSSSSGHLGNFHALQFNDSVLVSYVEFTTSKEIRHTKWMKGNGEIMDISLAVRPVAIAAYEQGVYYYYLEEDSKSIRLKAVIETTPSHARKEPASSVLLPEGILLAAYQDINMFFIILNRDENRITVLEIHGLEIVSEKNYSVPPVLAYNVRKPSHIEFFNGSKAPINTFKGSSKVKLYRYGDTLSIVVDSRSGIEKGTNVFVLLENGAVEQYFFPIETPDDFVSFLIDDKLFRSVINRKRFTLSAYDVTSQELLIKESLLKDEQEFDGYFRHARSMSISRQPLTSIMKAASVGDPSLTILKDSGKYIILWGLAINDNGIMGPVGVPSVVGVLTSIVGTAILQMTEGPGISQHFYFECNDEDFSCSLSEETSSYVRKRLDDYEIARQGEKVKIKYKNYIPFKNGIMSIYYEPKRKTATLVNFQYK